MPDTKVVIKSHQTDHVETVVNGIQTLAPRCGAALAVQHRTEVLGFGFDVWQGFRAVQ